MEKNIVFQNANLTQSALDAGDAQRSCAGVGDPIRCSPGTVVVAVDCSLARSVRIFKHFSGFEFILFSGIFPTRPAPVTLTINCQPIFPFLEE
jgi:hypothetical protein